MRIMTIDDFARQLNRMAREYPGNAEEALEKGAKYMLKEIKKASPVGKAAHPHKLKSSWRCKIQGHRAGELRAEIRSTAPHFHLVNRGFQRASPQGRPVPNSPHDNRNLHFLENAVDDAWSETKQKMTETFYAKVREHLG